MNEKIFTQQQARKYRKKSDIILPKGITQIGCNAFCECTSLKNIIIPDSVTSIGPEAFSGCTSLENIHIPDSVIAIEKNTFTRCHHLTIHMSDFSIKNILKSLFDIYTNDISIEN